VRRVKGDLGSKGRRTIGGSVLPPFSCIMGNDVKVNEVVETLVRYYFPRATRIWDPTCGEENYQFAAWIGNSKYDYFSSDVRQTKWSMFLNDVFLPGLRDSCVDVIVYDPPYVPYARVDDRGKNYAISATTSPLKVLDFYNPEIFRAFHRITRQGIIVKCADFYYPVNSNNLVPILPRIVPNIEKYFRVVSITVYRYFYRYIPLLQLRLRKIATKHRRALIVHTYYVVAHKKVMTHYRYQEISKDIEPISPDIF